MKLHRHFLAQAISVALASSTVSVYAEESFTLEEIVVTAQKRAESLQDVPISVNAVSGEFIQNSGVSNLEEMSAYVPNLNISDSPGTNQIVIRGLGSGAGNSSFEQSVGLYVDGVYAARARQFQVPFMDVERVEVLRGPQGVLFGKNSIAGAVSVISAKPTEDFEAEITGKYEMEYGSHEVDAFVSGQLAENLYGRLAVKTAGEEGYLDSEVLGKDYPEVETDAVRAVLVWDASEDTEVTLKLEHAELDEKGNNFQISDIDLTAPTPAGLAAGLHLAYKAAITAGQEDFKLNDKAFASLAPRLSLESDNVALQVKHSIGEYELTYLAGYSEYESDSVGDYDFSTVDYLVSRGEEEYKQSSHEIRLASPVGETFEYMLGAYYIDRDLDRPLSARDADFSFAGAPGAALNHSQFIQYDEQADAWSVFFQGTWNVTDTVRATLGARYSEETKEARGTHTLTALGDYSTAITNPAVLIPLAGLGIANNSFEGKRTEENLDPTFNVQWDFSGDGMAYLTWTKATKAGGFNASNNTPNPDNVEFEEEEAENIEVGVKLDLLDGRARLNAAYFNTKFDDLQVSSFDGSNFVTGNAAKAVSQGVELEATLAVTPEWTIGGNMAWLDAEYDEFDGPCSTNANEWNASCAASSGAVQDLSGAQLELAPEWSGTVFADYNSPIGDNLIFSARVDANYSDGFYTQPDQDSHNYQDDFWKVNLRLALSSADERWTVALLGTNLTDETTKNFGGSTSVLAGGYWSNTAPPRQVELSATYRFGK
ncbi:TonB-dependent receptor [Maricurvus nonylphenolicus]|uniref:TonB-dependent receptor n=1 Tax=Maricurvus nonylphenolicus TaxID=1008307 RepID=UPI0036F1BF9C